MAPFFINYYFTHEGLVLNVSNIRIAEHLCQSAGHLCIANKASGTSHKKWK